MGKVITGHCAAVAAAQHRKKTCMNAVYILIVVTSVCPSGCKSLKQLKMIFHKTSTTKSLLGYKTHNKTNTK